MLENLEEVISVGYTSRTGQREQGEDCSFTWYFQVGTKESLLALIQEEAFVIQFPIGNLRILIQGASQRKARNESQLLIWGGCHTGSKLIIETDVKIV